MNRALIIRPSSLGDIVHALPIVHDLHRHRPGLAIDWVAEEPFAAVVALNHGVRHVIPIALRRWRRKVLAGSTWREIRAFHRDLGREHYDAVIDLQEQVKGAAIAWLAHGPVHGPDRRSIREPAATLAYRHTYRIAPRQHLIDRCRQLAGKVFGYEPHGPPRFDLAPPALSNPPAKHYAVFLHGTSRDDKLWPEGHWRLLIERFMAMGIDLFLPWGSSTEQARSERLAAGAAGVTVPRRMELPQLAALLASARLVCGVDTGLVHLAAALGTPTISLFVATDPHLAGVERAGTMTRDLGGNATIPEPVRVIAAAEELLAQSRAS